MQYFQGNSDVMNAHAGWSGSPQFSDAREFIYDHLGIMRVSSNEDLSTGTDDRMIGIDTTQDSITEVKEGEFNIIFNVFSS